MSSPLRIVRTTARWAVTLLLGAVALVALLNLYSGPDVASGASTADATARHVAQAPFLASPGDAAFQVLDYKVLVGGCYGLDLHQVTYLAPGVSSAYVARWCD